MMAPYTLKPLPQFREIAYENLRRNTAASLVDKVLIIIVLMSVHRLRSSISVNVAYQSSGGADPQPVAPDSP